MRIRHEYGEIISNFSSLCSLWLLVFTGVSHINFRLLHLSKPGTSTGVVSTAAAAAASLMSDAGVTS